MTKIKTDVIVRPRGDEMARVARKKALYSTYHIRQHCPKQKIFYNKDDRLIFIEILSQVKAKYDFKLYGLAIDAYGYELILYDNGSDISKIMKSLNISFSMKYKCRHQSCDQLFKERYKSMILEPHCIQNAISNLPICLYGKSEMIDVYQSTDHVEGTCIDCYEKAKEKLLEIIESEGYTFEDMLKKKKVRNDLIKKFRQNSVLSLVELGELFGGLSESAISKILNK